MDEITRQLIDAVHAAFDKARNDLEAKLLGSGQAAFQKPELRDLQYAQNTLRTCIEAVLNKFEEPGQTIAIELAVRLASYALSWVPMEDQDFVVAGFMRTFVMAHESRMHNGIRISSVWEMRDGRILPNYPDPKG